jgi:hypothetical protein
MRPTHNTLPESIRAQSVELLNKHLAATIDLHAQVKQAHWNVRGPGFIVIHKLFDTVSVEVENYSDLIAERWRTRRHRARHNSSCRAAVLPGSLCSRHRRREAARICCLQRLGSVRPIRSRGHRSSGDRRRRNPTCSPKSRAGSINSCGSSNLTYLHNDQNTPFSRLGPKTPVTVRASLGAQCIFPSGHPH